MSALLHEGYFPLVIAHGGEVAIARPIQELFVRSLGDFSFEIRNPVVSIKVDFVRYAAALVALEQFFLDVGVARCCHQSGYPVFEREDVVHDCARLDDARPARHGRGAIAALPLCVLLPTEGDSAAIWP